MNINVRGISSLSATSPLYVIDGVYGDINMVDPADIQSIEVLKDASAAAIYGSRAANGVVLVTTKGGRLETPARVTVDAYTGVQMVAKYIDVMDGNQLRDLAKATGYSSAEGLLNWNGGAGTDWQKELYNSAMVSKVSLNVSGGNKTSTYNLSGSYLNQDGIVNTTGYEAWNIRAKNTFSFFNNHLRMGTTLMMKFYKKKYEDVSYTSALTAVPMWNVYGEDGTWGVAPEWTRGDNPVGWTEAYDYQRHGIDILLNGYAEVSGNYVFAQDAVKQWSLEECIQYAIEHNIDLKQKEQEQESRKVDLHTSKYSWLPALNGSLGQSFQFGRSTSKSGVIVDQNAANSTLGINLDMPLFDGLKIPNDIAARKLDLKASIENLNKAREDLSINIASYYLQVLYNKELLKIAQLQVELDKEQVNKTEAMVNAGKVPLSQLYDIKAQLAKDEVTLTESQNNVNLALLDLAQSLELERSDRSFDIQTPVIEDAVADNMSSILPPENIYDHAVTFKPQIKEQQYLLESQKKMLRVAQAGYYPKLNFGASYSNGYYHSTSGGEFADTRSFSEQFKQNGEKIVGFSLSIPLFNRFQVRNSVRTARINIINRELLMENTKKTLYKEIQQAYYNATAFQEKYTASDKSVTASKEAFNYAQERYNAGKSTVFEFNEAKTKYAQSLAEQAQAKYDFIFRTKILDFYNGNPIRL